jgi:DNA repair exonuclease SbcCD ATPase subunit
MGMSKTTREASRLQVRNIGGIDETTIDIPHGVTALVGRNATNRTSLLQALMAACGSEHVSLKGNADEGSVELTINDATYTRTLTRHNGTITTTGEPFLDDSILADLFAFLLETNETRRAVEQGTDLRDLIVRPIDTETIQHEIERLDTECHEIEERLSELDDLDEQLPDLEQRRHQLDEQIADKRDERDATQVELDAADQNIQESNEEKTEREQKIEEFRTTRSTLERVRSELDVERESAADLREEIAEKTEEFKGHSETQAGEINEIDAKIDRLRTQKRAVESAMNQFQRIVEFNESMLDGSNDELLKALQETGGDNGNPTGAITDRLLGDETVLCWTCGSEIEQEAIGATLNRLRGLRKDKLNETNAIDDQLDDLQQQQRELTQQQRRRKQLERTLDDLETELERTETTIDNYEKRQDDLDSELNDLETAIEELQDESDSEVLELHKAVNQLEFELEQLETERTDVTEEIERIEARLDDRDDLDAQHAELQDAIDKQRTRIERIEQEAIEQFNEQMEDLLALLDYANLERIWLERRETEVREGRQKITKTVFDLHVVRETESGTTYEDTVAHLSESEREITGLVFALSGYLTHEVYETVPFLILDSLEAIDSKRIATLIDYVSDYTDYVIAALLPEDAAALDGDYQRITEI